MEMSEASAAIQRATELGEKLYPETSADGRDAVRQELRKLAEKQDSLTEKLSAQQQQLNESQSQLSSFEDGLSQLDRWLAGVETKLKLDQSSKATLTDKKALLQALKVQHQDIQSHNRILDTLSEKAKAIGKKAPDSRAVRQLADVVARYKAACSRSEDALATVKQAVADHQRYEELCQLLDDKLTQVNSKMTTTGAASGDRFVLQGKMEALQVCTLSVSYFTVFI